MSSQQEAAVFPCCPSSVLFPSPAVSGKALSLVAGKGLCCALPEGQDLPPAAVPSAVHSTHRSVEGKPHGVFDAAQHLGLV